MTREDSTEEDAWSAVRIDQEISYSATGHLLMPPRSRPADDDDIDSERGNRDALEWGRIDRTRKTTSCPAMLQVEMHDES
jgi:hypothetical protein